MPLERTNPVSLEYVVVDVFTDRPFAGNPLAVVFGADDLTSEQLLAIATEFNLSETSFPLPLGDNDADVGADYRLRIFTPGGEVPFAGHPTVGSAWVLRDRGVISPGLRKQSCGAGLIDVAVPGDQTAAVELSAVPRDPARALSADEVAAVCSLVGLDPSDVAGPAHVAGCGLTWLYLPVTEPAVSRARPSGRQVSEVAIDKSGLADPLDGIDVYAVSATPAGGQPDSMLQINSRVFVPGFGIPEDPATGSAAAGLGLALVAAGLATADGETAYRITQGVDMGRPSLLLGRVAAEGGLAVRTHVAGQVVPVASGRIRLP